jgi:hypothetical protein
MKISRNTILVLENFADINSSIFIKEGNVIETISPTTTIKAIATLDVTFPRSFALYKLGKFLSTLSLFNDPSIDFQENCLVIEADKRSARLMYSDSSLVTRVSSKKIELPSVDVLVTLTNDNLAQVHKALKVMELSDIVISGEGGEVYISASDSKNPSGDELSIYLGNTDKTFKAVFKSENIKFMPGTYDVEICAQGIARFKSEKVEYFVAVESNESSFE